MSEETTQETKKPEVMDSSFLPPTEPNGQMGQGQIPQEYTAEDLNVIMNLIHGCTIKGADAPIINALGQKTTMMIQKLQGN